MILQSKHPTTIAAMDHGWHEGFPQDALISFEFKYDGLGASPRTTKLEIEGNRQNPTEAPETILKLVGICEEDYRAQNLVADDVVTEHTVNVRTGTENQSSTLNLMSRFLIEIVQFAVLNRPEEKIKSPTLFRNRQITHIDFVDATEEEIVYLGASSNGTLSWQQRFYVPNLAKTRLGEYPIGMILSAQSVTKPIHISDNTLVRARIGTFAHAKPRIRKKDEAARVFFRNSIRPVSK